MLLNHLIYFSSQNREKNNHQTWKQLVPEYDTTKKGELHPVHGEVHYSTWTKGPELLKKRTTQKMEATHAGGGMETTRAEASNAEACHAEATNNYTEFSQV